MDAVESVSREYSQLWRQPLSLRSLELYRGRRFVETFQDDGKIDFGEIFQI